MALALRRSCVQCAVPLGRAVALGSGAGVVAGGLLGTIAWPVVGTFFGAWLGLELGVLLGIINGLLLAALVQVSTSHRVMRAGAAATSLACGLTAIGTLAPQAGWDALPPLVTVTALSGLLAPVAAFGAEPVDLGRRWGRRPPSDLAVRFLGAGAALGAAVGGLVGLLLGSAHLPTLPFAIVEGGLLGAVSGVEVGLLAVAVVIGPRLRARR